MINSRVAAAAVSRMAMMKFFPQDDGVKAELAKMLVEMCSTDEQVEWLAKRMANLFNQWPGPYELRSVFCSKFKPKDGIEAESGTYPDGIPSEIPARNYELLSASTEQKRLTGESISPALPEETNADFNKLLDTVTARSAALSTRPMIAHRAQDGKAEYHFTCVACSRQEKLAVPLEAKRFACPFGCGAVYEQWQYITGNYRIACVYKPGEAKREAGAA